VRRDTNLYLEDIVDVCRKIELYTAGLTFAEFEADQKTIDAVVRNIEIIGEAARNIPVEVRSQMSDVAWNDAADMRNAIIHGYFAVDLDIVWDVVKTKIAPLASCIGDYLGSH
jgi:uncharacterized protein with HEPN domain